MHWLDIAGFVMILCFGGEMAHPISVFCTHLLALQLQHCQKPCSQHVFSTFLAWPCQEFDVWRRWPRFTRPSHLGLRLWPKNWISWNPGWLAEVALSTTESWMILHFRTPLSSPLQDMEQLCVLVEIWGLKVQNFPTQTLVKKCCVSVFFGFGNSSISPRWGATDQTHEWLYTLGPHWAPHCVVWENVVFWWRNDSFVFWVFAHKR